MKGEMDKGGRERDIHEKKIMVGIFSQWKKERDEFDDKGSRENQRR